MQNIKNIIFDLGGVILNIDLKQTELAFEKLGVKEFKQYYTLQALTPLFEQFEIGEISPEVFYERFRKLAGMQLTDEQIKEAWNALLLDFPEERIEWLEQISKRYKVFLLSNTNQIHYDEFTRRFEEQIGKKHFNEYFIKAYYSHELKLRKPLKQAFQFVLKNEHLKAEETLFIDDSLANVEAANSVGLQTIHLVPPQTILELDL